MLGPLWHDGAVMSVHLAASADAGHLQGARVRVGATTPSGTELAIGDDRDALTLPDRPDRAGAARVVAALDRVVWQRLEVEDDTVTGVVIGVRRRRPVELRVDAGTALGLVEAGVPTLGRFAVVSP